MASSVRKARTRLAGLGPELKAVAPQICLVDPFPDPSTGETVTEGSVVDVGRREIWMAVTAESPAESPERPLALLLGSALPAAADLGFLLEGFGFAVRDAASPDAELANMDLPNLADADGELRTAMIQSFVAFLLAQASRDDFLRMLNTAEPGRVDVAAQAVYGQSLAALEESWTDSLVGERPKVKIREFFGSHDSVPAPASATRDRDLRLHVVRPRVHDRLPVRDETSARHRDSRSTTSRRSSQILGVLAIAFVISLLAGLRRAYLSAYVSSAVTRDLRVDMFTRLQSLSAGWFGRQQEGDVMSRLFSDVGQLESAISGTIREGIFQALSVGVSAVVLLTLDPLLGVIVIVGAPLVGLVYRVMSTGRAKAQPRGARRARWDLHRGVGELRSPSRGEGLRSRGE